MPEIFILMQAINLLWLVGLTLTTWLRKPGVEAAKAVQEVEADMNKELHLLAENTDRQLRDQLVQITQIQAHMSHMPSSIEVSDLRSAVKAIDERTQGIHEAMNSLSGSVNRINDFLRQSR